MDTHFGRYIMGAREGAPSFSAYGNVGTIALTAEPRNAEELRAAIEVLSRECAFDIVGRATDTLFPDGLYDAAVLTTRSMTGAEFCGTRVVAAAGEKLPLLAGKAAARGLSGLEQLCSIPGSVGGAAVMNAGAFGREFGELVEWADVIEDGRERRMSAEECAFRYRSSALGGKVIVVAVALRLGRSDVRDVRAAMDEFCARRAATQPTGKSLGSVFARHDGTSAGWYIERAGFKGAKCGGAQISSRHANFIVNTGGGTAADYLSLLRRVRDGVFAHSGVRLVPEIKALGEEI